jgi:hypothetical protein
MSLIDTCRFSAHPDIRREIKIVAVQPIVRKRIEYSRTFAALRKFAERTTLLPKYPKKNYFLSPKLPAQVACKGSSAYSKLAQANRAARF